MRLPRFELGTSTLSVLRSNQLSYNRGNLGPDVPEIDILDKSIGGKEIRTPDLLNANQMLSQLSYAPKR